jgi:hypothetical protein
MHSPAGRHLPRLPRTSLRRLTVGLWIALCLCIGATASAATQARIDVGVYASDVPRFDRLTGQHSDSTTEFLGWDQGRTWGKNYGYFLDMLGDRPHIELKTKSQGGAISTKEIALGQGDAHLTGLALAIAESGKPVLLRPLGEMNNSANVYCACRGGAANSTEWYRRAFQRIYVIMHGGTAVAMSAKLRALGMPGVTVDVPPNPYPHLTVVWNPLAVGVPAVSGNGFRDYSPGTRYFDAYGNDYYDFGTYSFSRTTELYDAYPDKPFVIPEWGLAIDDPGYVRAFADFVRAHRRVTFIGFFNGRAGEQFDLGSKPKSLAAYRRSIVPLTR